MNSLRIENLHVSREGKEIVKGVSLTIRPGEVHALMGPNGSGKSSLANALMGHPKYAITAGSIVLDGADITKAAPDVRSRAGLFLSMQYPPEIAGVMVSNFLRTAVNATRAKPYNVVEFHRLLKEKMAELKIDAVFGGRSLNEGFSGGEKKRAEILQMMMLNPKYAVLDETDSGLDVDALKIVTDGINAARGRMGVLLITHYAKMLSQVVPDFVHVMSAGVIVAEGGKELAELIERGGYGAFIA
ncbi:Fe-S cluster assembly ATPase SufC [Candidatus Uhrbacteria bacterium]|nr:Fe-S cluster assembly ATPase SufC [Candidatus Uhrbacteria bacterium]